MKLIVGLGNPGTEYDKTRHNVGFVMLDKIASTQDVVFNKEKFGGLYCEYNYNGDKVLLLKPQKYINLSGEVIIRFIDYFKINTDDMVIICDDMNIELGSFKIKSKGSSGGHNGLKNIEMHLRTSEYKRIKIGISQNKLIDSRNYVLGKFSEDDYDKIIEISKIFPKVIEDYFELSFANLMNKYNKKQT